MPPQIARILCIVFVVWLFLQDRKRNRAVSPALWIPFVWGLIIGSKPVSAWLGLSVSFESSDDYIEGSPFDRLAFLSLIVIGFVVLLQRQVRWTDILRQNGWLVAYFGYLGLSTLWSDYPFVSFKRWVKDVGNVIMALIVLTDQQPRQALISLLARCTYMLVPFSVLYIKYFPELGRYYDRWTYQPYFCGVTTNKNLLGMALFVCGVFLAWRFLDTSRPGVRRRTKAETLELTILSLMVAWLLHMAHSSTAVVCSILAVVLLYSLRVEGIRRRAIKFGAYGLAVVLIFLVLHTSFGLGELLVRLVGRDMTFTGRTDIWQSVLAEKSNPIIGVGFYSFWLGDRVERLSEKYFYHLNEAHNGYLETYLNSGLIGVALLLMVFGAALKDTKTGLARGNHYAMLRYAFIVAAAWYNMSEAAFDRLDLIWFVLVLFFLRPPQEEKLADESTLRREQGNIPVELGTTADFRPQRSQNSLFAAILASKPLVLKRRLPHF